MSPLMLVVVVCLVVAAMGFGGLAVLRLRRMLDGPRRWPALAGLLALNLIWISAVVTVIVAVGQEGTAGFFVLGLMPSISLLQVKDLQFPPAVRYAVNGFGVVAYLGAMGLIAWAMRNGPRELILQGVAIGLIFLVAMVTAPLADRLWNFVRRSRAWP